MPDKHPLFDDASFYRLATGVRHWEDGGKQSVRDFFHALSIEQLKAEWQTEVPAEPQDWGLGELNAEAHEYLSGAPLPSNKSRKTGGGIRVRGIPRNRVHAGEDLTPALIVAEFDAAGTVSLGTPCREPESLFTGIGNTARAELHNEFVINVGDLPPQRDVLVFLLTTQILSRLRELLSMGSREAPVDDEAAAGVLQKVLRSRVLNGDEDDSAGEQADPQLAYRVSCALAGAPVFTAGADDDGRVSIEIRLDKPSPTLELGTWVLVCISPSGTDD